MLPARDEASPGGWLVVVAVMLPTTLAGLSPFICSVALDHIAGAMAVAPDELTWAVTAHIVAYSVMLPISVWLSPLARPPAAVPAGHRHLHRRLRGGGPRHQPAGSHRRPGDAGPGGRQPGPDLADHRHGCLSWPAALLRPRRLVAGGRVGNHHRSCGRRPDHRGARLALAVSPQGPGRSAGPVAGPPDHRSPARAREPDAVFSARPGRARAAGPGRRRAAGDAADGSAGRLVGLADHRRPDPGRRGLAGAVRGAAAAGAPPGRRPVGVSQPHLRGRLPGHGGAGLVPELRGRPLLGLLHAHHGPRPLAGRPRPGAGGPGHRGHQPAGRQDQHAAGIPGCSRWWERPGRRPACTSWPG